MATKTDDGWVMTAADLEGVDYHVMPRDQGQIVEVSYGLWSDGAGDGLVIRRTHDRSDGEVSYDAAPVGDTFEPQNGDNGAAGEFRPLEVR